MSSAETMMWHIEQDPWLSPSGGSITIFDRPLDVARFRRLITTAVAEVPRLRQRVVEPATRLGTPHWETDHEFDLAWHVREIGAPGEGTMRDLLDWLSLWLQDPYDRSRPLWQYVLVHGLADGRGALAMRLHHVVTDGQGAVRMAGSYTSTDPDQPDPPAVDLDEVLARSRPTGGEADRLSSALADLFRIPAGATKAVTQALTHPDRLGAVPEQLGELVRTASDTRHGAGSPLWATRSRRRHLEVLSLPFDQVHDAAKRLGGTVNDAFVTAAVEGAVRYHDEMGARLEHLHISFVVSTRRGSTGSENAFTPVPVDVPIAPMPLSERFAALHALLRSRREQVHGDGALANVAVVANLLPTAIVTGVAKGQSAHIDFATSNLPGYLGDTWVAGARTLHSYPFGPVAGTAFNLTAYSTAGSLDLGINLDPAAVTDPGRLRTCLESAWADVMRHGASGARRPTRRATPRSS